nr:hypothetical protein [Chryseobacterium arthrosphaerae]
MPDLGRWNGMDQLAESYLSTSPYAYVANNPVLQFDVDGRWFNQDGTIDTSGRTPAFTTGRQYYFSFLGIDPNYSAGGGESATGQTSSDGGNSSGKGVDGEVINIPEVVLPGKSSLLFGLKLRNLVNAYMEVWNAQNNLRTCGYCQDKGGVQDVNILAVPYMLLEAGITEGLMQLGVEGNSAHSTAQVATFLYAMKAPQGVSREMGILKSEVQAEKNLALGLGDDLFNFAEKNSFHTYRDFSKGFDQSKILNAMNSYDKIHFNTTRFGKINFSRFNPKAPLTYKNYTNWEMHTIMNNPSLLQKTVFYRKATDGSYQILDSYSPFY